MAGYDIVTRMLGVEDRIKKLKVEDQITAVCNRPGAGTVSREP